jgi:hypothetical protein
MKSVTIELESIIKEYSQKVSVLPESELSLKPTPHKWSKKEIIGHLIDSGQNNLRRFICGQYEESPSKIIYAQDFWVAANDYQNQPGHSIVLLWQLINHQIINVLKNMPVEHYTKQSNTGELHTLEWLASDYVKHMKHHLNQIFPGSFPIVYP